MSDETPDKQADAIKQDTLRDVRELTDALLERKAPLVAENDPIQLVKLLGQTFAKFAPILQQEQGRNRFWPDTAVGFCSSALTLIDKQAPQGTCAQLRVRLAQLAARCEQASPASNQGKG